MYSAKLGYLSIIDIVSSGDEPFPCFVNSMSYNQEENINLYIPEHY